MEKADKRILVVDDTKAIFEVISWFQVLRHLEHFV